MKIIFPGCLVLAAMVAVFDSRAFAAAKDPFAENIRTTEPLTPEEELKTFTLPPGFTMQLVAAEPELRKPMNMAWDAAGRLWITESREYPLPAKNPAEARDTIRIFSDFDANGRARKMTVFATNLNIPIGLYPFRSASKPGAKPTWKCAVWSIPNIWLLEDTDGDGVADKKEILYGPFDTTRDTHGNLASFRRGFDGWIYGTHGFNNDSHVRGPDGNEVHLQSGNTWRARLDGSRLEHWTHGQVNPFGLTFDPLGNLWSADCHSSPIYQLLRGAYYPSFGKPHDGLGFAPTTINHSHGSTAIAGIVYVSDPSWPAEYQDNIFIGNVMTSRINRDKINFIGSTSKGVEQPDFLTTTDPWFRPVDLQFGPDGALYVADFYNRIIGHYEVPLTHPGRDRERGRIWRIVHTGSREGREVSEGKTKPSQTSRDPLPDLTKLSVNELITELGSPNMTRRMLAMNELCDCIGQGGLNALLPLKVLLASPSNGLSGVQIAQSLHVLDRLGQLDDPTLTRVGASNTFVRIHTLQMIAERGHKRSIAPKREDDTLLPLSLTNSVRSALRDTNAFAQRAAVEVLGAWPSHENIALLVMLQRRASTEDTHLAHVVRMALRDQLSDERTMRFFLGQFYPKQETTELVRAALGTKSEAAAAYIFANKALLADQKEFAVQAIHHAIRYADVGSLNNFTFDEAFAAQSSISARLNLDEQADLLSSVLRAMSERGSPYNKLHEEWGFRLCRRLLTSNDTNAAAWVNAPLDGAKDTRNPWVLQERKCADGQTAQVMSSFPNGETLTGVLRSAPFPLPAKLSFWLCGHDGFPTAPAGKKNFVRLIDADTKRVLREAAPPRNDTAQKITWDLAEFAGKRGVIEATDGDDGKAYAWLAFGRFEPALPALALGEANQSSKRQIAGADIARTLKLASVEPQLVKLFAAASDADTRVAAGRAWLAVNPSAAIAPVEKLVRDAAQPELLRERLGAELARAPGLSAIQSVVVAMNGAPARLQAKFALALAGTANGAEQVLQAAELGRIPARLLQDKALANLLTASGAKNAGERLAALTKNLQPADVAIQKLITQKRAAFDVAKASAARGAELFTQVCAACHQLDGKGAVVGPQLDGVGNRGLERLLEDILDPNANVDRAFRVTTFVLANGEVTSGLFRRDEGEQVIVAESTGKETALPKKQIKERHETERSLMPDNFGEAMQPGQLNDLLAFLLSKTGREAQRK